LRCAPLSSIATHGLQTLLDRDVARHQQLLFGAELDHAHGKRGVTAC
jgi:hypothetical protein